MKLVTLAWIALAPILAPDTMREASRPDTAPEPRWSASILYDYLDVSPTLGGWHTYGALVGRRFSGGALFVELLETDRFERRDAAAALDAYLDLWSGAYGNLRVQGVADAESLPRRAVRFELVQSLGQGWEAAGSYQRQSFPQGGIDQFGVTIARYLGDWYLRQRSALVSVAGETSASFAVHARRYLGSVDDLIDLTVAGGEEVVTLDLGPRVDVRSTAHASARLQRYVLPHLGASVGVSYTRYQALPARRGISIGLHTRW